MNVESQIEIMMEDVRTKDQLSQMKAMLKYVYFSYNTPERWIEKCFAEEGSVMVNHLQSKYMGYGFNVNRFFVELDSHLQHVMLKWIVENYHGADRLADKL